MRRMHYNTFFVENLDNFLECDINYISLIKINKLKK